MLEITIKDVIKIMKEIEKVKDEKFIYSSPRLRRWYKQVMKKADASSGEDPGASYYEGRAPGEVPNEIMFGPFNPPFPFAPGDKVRLRKGGLGFEQIVGRVTKQDVITNKTSIYTISLTINTIKIWSF